MNAAEKYRPAKQIEPHWHVQTGDGEWVLVSMVVESETPDGGRRVRFYSDDRPAMVLDEAEEVMSRPPDAGPTAAVGSGSSTLD
jgi:hypothetical protein